MLGNVSLKVKALNNGLLNNDFKSDKLNFKSIDIISGMRASTFKCKSFYKEIKRNFTKEEKVEFNSLIKYIDENVKSIGSATLSFTSNGKSMLSIDLLSGEKELNDLLYINSIRSMSNSSYIFCMNAFAIIYTVLFLSLLNDGNNFNYLFTAISMSLLFLYASAFPVFAIFSLFKSKRMTGTSYFDGKFIGRYVTYPIVYIFILYTFSYFIESIFIIKGYRFEPIYPFHITSLLLTVCFLAFSLFIYCKSRRSITFIQNKFLVF